MLPEEPVFEACEVCPDPAMCQAEDGCTADSEIVRPADERWDEA